MFDPLKIPMNRKLLSGFVGAVIACATTLPSWAAASAPPTVTVTGSATVASQYMFRGLRLSGAAIQPAVEVGAGNLTLGVWSNFPFDGDKVPDSSDPEIDLYGGYTVPVSDAVSIVPGFTLYHFPNAPESLGFYRWTFEPNVALNYTVNGFKFTPKIYYDTVLNGATFEFTAFYAIPLKDIGSELDFTATYGTYKWREFAAKTTPEVKAWGDYWSLGVAMPFQLSPKAKLTLGFAFAEGRDAFTKAGIAGKTPNTGAIGRGVASLSYSYSF
jgi:uncharacterized protein (TIGR02001 family)